MTRVDGSARVSRFIPVFKIGGTGVTTGSAGSIPVRSRIDAARASTALSPGEDEGVKREAGGPNVVHGERVQIRRF